MIKLRDIEFCIEPFTNVIIYDVSDGEYSYQLYRGYWYKSNQMNMNLVNISTFANILILEVYPDDE